MRPPLPAIALLLASLVGGFGAAAAGPAADPKAAAPVPAPGPPPAAADNDAAARHAKLTACLKDAKAKKLVGAQKSAFVKDCVAAR